MNAWLFVGATLLLGLSVSRALLRQRGAPGFAEVVATGCVAMGVWLAALDLLETAWSAALLLLPGVVAGALALTAMLRQRSRFTTPSRWEFVAVIATLPHAVMVAAVPAFGWDFRYVWGLKAEVFARAGGLDWAWLEWPGHAFAHPSYPPLWSALVAAVASAGAPVAVAASTWQALLVLALAASCWQASHGAAPWARALAAAVGGWSPVLFLPRYSGLAEPLLALFAAVALAGLARLGREDRAALPILAVAVAGLALTKSEGIALGLAVAVAAVRLAGLRAAAGVALSYLVAVGSWLALLLHHGVADHERDLSATTALRHAADLPGAVVAAMTPLSVVLVVGWALALVSLRGEALRGVRLVLALWFAAVVAAYLTTAWPLAWHVATSLDRVLAVALPAAVAASLSVVRGEGAGGPPAPDSPPGG